MIHYRECAPLWSAALAALTDGIPPHLAAAYELLREATPLERWGVRNGVSDFGPAHGWLLAVAAAVYVQVVHHPGLSLAASARAAVAQLRG